MEFETPNSKVYIQTDAEGHIIRCEGGYTTPADLSGWLEIDEGNGDRYNLCQSHYFDGGLYTMDGIPRYRWDGTQAVERTEEELEADRKIAMQPTEAEVRAQRDKLLAETDWTQVADAPIASATRSAMRVYRQLLRDVTEQEGFPTQVVWPEMPTVVKAIPEPIDEVVEAIIGVEVTA